MRTPIVYTGGTFDLFHWGHVEFLRQCAFIGRVIVSLNTDEFVERYKKQKPLCSYREREHVLRGCKYVYGIVENVGCEDSKPAILSVRPDYIVIGSDWKDKDYYAQMQFTPEWLRSQGIALKYIPYTVGISTTELRKRLCER